MQCIRPHLVAASCLCAVFATGCADEQESLIFLHVPAWPSEGQCAVDPTSDVYLPRGQLDLAFETGYEMPGILLNQIIGSAPESTANGLNDGEISLKNAEVRLTSPRDPAVIDAVAAANPAHVEFQATVPTNSLEPGERHAVLLEVITPQAATELANAIRSLHGTVPFEVVAHVVYNAKRTGSSRKATGTVSSREFSFPIDTCFGCLIDCSACPGGACPTSASGEWVGGTCRNAQDAPIQPYECTIEDPGAGG